MLREAELALPRWNKNNLTPWGDKYCERALSRNTMNAILWTQYYYFFHEDTKNRNMLLIYEQNSGALKSHIERHHKLTDWTIQTKSGMLSYHWVTRGVGSVRESWGCRGPEGGTWHRVTSGAGTVRWRQGKEILQSLDAGENKAWKGG